VNEDTSGLLGVAFSEASRSQGAYDRDEVDAFRERVAATLRDPSGSGALTPADITNVAFPSRRSDDLVTARARWICSCTAPGSS